MSSPVTTTRLRRSRPDLRALAGMLREQRPDLPVGDGLPPSLLADLKAQIPCDLILFTGMDSKLQTQWFIQGVPGPSAPTPGRGDLARARMSHLSRTLWQHYWDCEPCSYHDRSGDLASVVKLSDFYTARQWRSTAMRSEYYQQCGLAGTEHQLFLNLPGRRGPASSVRLTLNRSPGAGFSDDDRALTLLRPHLRQAYRDAQRRRSPAPVLSARQTEVLRLVAAGHTNGQIARRLDVSESTVRTHLENIFERLHVSSRTAAVTCAFPDLVGETLPLADDSDLAAR
jgi:DNA-binding CsgD family transcriptional regulator